MTRQETVNKYNKSKKGQLVQKKFRESGKKAISARKNNLAWRIKARREMLEKLGNECIKCGFNDPRALQIDHIQSGGTKERKEIGIYTFYKQVMADNGEHYQLLCANCNWIKRYEKNEWKGRIAE